MDYKAATFPWASFCMSTFKRPELLKSQIASLLQQTFVDFEIVIADNDPENSGMAIAESFNDARVKYESNGENIGMVKSFNKSVERSRGKYIVMVTDDDPVNKDYLEAINEIVQKYPGYSFYGGMERKQKKTNEIELIKKEDFIRELLDPEKTTGLLWSSCLLEREAFIQMGILPDYGSPHLVDHALLAIVGSIDGAVVINKMFSNIVYHQTNFSKSNFDYYYISCLEFYKLMDGAIKNKPFYRENKKIVVKHLGKWFISSIFNLLNFYGAIKNFDEQKTKEIKVVGKKILQLPFMKKFSSLYKAKLLVLFIKFKLGIKK